MKCILFILEKPSDENTKDRTAWRDTITTLDNMKGRTSSIENPTEGIYLIPVDTDMLFVGTAIQKAYPILNWRFLFFEEMPQWVQSQNNPP